MRSGFWKADGFLGLAVVSLFALLTWMSDLAPGLETRATGDKVEIIAIDKLGVDNIGCSPWPRDTHAKLVELLAHAKARGAGYRVFFAEPENERINRTLAKGESMAQLMFRIANEPPTDIRSFAEIPEGLVRFLERALAKNPEERYQTAKHFGGELRMVLGTAAKVDLEI